MKQDVIPLVAKLVKDESPAVRRELCVALRHNKSDRMPELWAELALAHVKIFQYERLLED